MRRIALCLCLLLPSLAQAADLTGLWVGYYAYETDQRIETAMVLQQLGDDVGGMMIERQTFGDEIVPGLPAELAGFVDEEGLYFEKYYFHQSEDAPGVEYELTLSADGNVLSGHWYLGEMEGTAYFRRSVAQAAERAGAR